MNIDLTKLITSHIEEFEVNGEVVIPGNLFENTSVRALKDVYFEGSIVKLCDGDFNFKPLQDEIFFTTNVKDFEDMVNLEDVTKVASVASDGLSELLAEQIDAFDEEEFNAYVAYHLARCEREELFGYSSHMLYICKKN